MNWQAMAFDWNQARAFLATAEEGSLSAAARALGQTQPTLSRQVAGLEEDLGIALFERVGRSLVLTEGGMDLLEHFRSMAEAAARISLLASGRSQAIEGHVTITATDFTAMDSLPPILKTLRQLAPGITVDVIASNEVRDLMRREADISIRHARPEQPELIARKLGETTGQFYASREYLERFGRPASPTDIAHAEFIGFETTDRLVPFFNELGVPVTRDNFKVSSASSSVIRELVREGIGIGVLSREMAARMPELEQVLTDVPAFPIPIWLVTHRELHTSRRIRLVFDLLAKELTLPPRA